MLFTLSPGLPGKPGTPSSPWSPILPFSPEGPTRPFRPGCPGMPSSPRGPFTPGVHREHGAPGSPAQTTHCYWCSDLFFFLLLLLLLIFLLFLLLLRRVVCFKGLRQTSPSAIEPHDDKSLQLLYLFTSQPPSPPTDNIWATVVVCGKRGDYQNCSYSSLDWVLSHWTHFSVHRFIFVVLMFVYFVCICFILHMCCIIVKRWGGPGGIEN